MGSDDFINIPLPAKLICYILKDAPATEPRMKVTLGNPGARRRGKHTNPQRGRGVITSASRITCIRRWRRHHTCMYACKKNPKKQSCAWIGHVTRTWRFMGSLWGCNYTKLGLKTSPVKGTGIRTFLYMFLMALKARLLQIPNRPRCEQCHCFLRSAKHSFIAK